MSIPIIDLEPDIEKVVMLWKRRQFLIYPSLFFTLHKSQGYTTLGKYTNFLLDQLFYNWQVDLTTTRTTHQDHLKDFIKSTEVGVINVVIFQI